ncbi:Sec-independent protein translocase subunit TatA/TatB [Blattabacterium cuenoti]|uniref:Sec-independent protein translocase subunit TatA/TatB n=1 Tax=Blattabacterium cuenoti TaxID=1653831 RepID=UPI00163BE1F5|nr:twin-arginine translocase TatA/TatE family subunit [Blattabacterium cuenoti]
MKNFLFISIEESFLIILIAIIIFGPKKIPNIARGLGEGIRYLKEAKNQIQKEIYKDSPTINNNSNINKNKKKPYFSIKRNK